MQTAMANVYNLLTDEMPDFITVCGVRYPVVTDFRRWILVVELFDDEEVCAMVKAACAVKLIFHDSGALLGLMRDPAVCREVVGGITRFAACGRVVPERKGAGSMEDTRAFDFSCDAELIFASFMQVYGMDLCAPGLRMHFWKFMALLRNLPRESEFMRVVSLRMTDTTKIENDNLRRSVRRAKAAVRIR